MTKAKDIREVTGDFNTGIVKVDGEAVPLEPSLKLINHSPTGFAWGYGGSGPSQLALAILLMVTKSKQLAEGFYQTFKWDVIAKLPQSDFRIVVDFTYMPPILVYSDAENKIS